MTAGRVVPLCTLQIRKAARAEVSRSLIPGPCACPSTKAQGKAMIGVPIGCVPRSRLLKARLGCQVKRHTVLARREHQKRHRYPQPPVKKTHVEADIIGAVCV